MQMVEVGMGDQHGINGRQIAQPHSRSAQPFQDENPACEVRINENVLAADLQEKAGMPNESEAELVAPG